MSLNIHFNYGSELIIRPATDLFEFPSEISVDVFVKDKCIYTDNLKFIPSSNFKNFGVYTVDLNLNRYLERNYKNVYVVIRFNNETSKILLHENMSKK